MYIERDDFKATVCRLSPLRLFARYIVRKYRLKSPPCSPVESHTDGWLEVYANRLMSVQRRSEAKRPEDIYISADKARITAACLDIHSRTESRRRLSTMSSTPSSSHGMDAGAWIRFNFAAYDKRNYLAHSGNNFFLSVRFDSVRFNTVCYAWTV